jgi:hypothetical protein
MQLRPNHQIMMDRFIKACQTDDRIAAALHVGSYVKDLADEHSDLDLYLITSDDAYEAFTSDHESFIRQLGEPLFMENFELSDILFLIFQNGSEVEISIGRESRLNEILNEPYKVLLDKKDVTANIVPRARQIDEGEQTEKLRRLIYWFWHELSHFTTALARGQLWWAQGQLGAMRLYCINLLRLQNNFSDQEIGEEGYFKIENAIPVEQLSVLKGTYCPMEEDAMLESAFVIVRFFRDLAIALAETHGIPYPERLDTVMVERLEKLRDRV